MKIVLLDGGLFNQVTQYVFARNVEMYTGEKVYLDDSWFYINHSDDCNDSEKHIPLDYQLTKFPNAKPNLLSQYFSPDVWDGIIAEIKKLPPTWGGSYMPQILKNNGLDLFVICESPMPNFDGNIAYMPYYYCLPEMLRAQGTVYYHGYFTHGDWFMRHKDTFLHELTLPPLSEPDDIAMAEQIQNSLSVCIHVRRGGYAAQGATIIDSYYQTSIKQIMEKTKEQNPCFYVFSDDIDWCKENTATLGLDMINENLIYGKKERTVENNHCDLQLMAMCDIMILSQSVYSFYAALLNPKEHKAVMNPMPGRGVF